ncbi:MAG TPA: YceI family protein [Ktedonobacteraceae bacterium]|nr:YceI family protein [Ktedonobacteraceae bacterium]
MAWNIDAAHSQATFSVKHMMISTVRGHFEVLSGQLEIDEQHPENSWVEAEVDAASINTRDAKRDGHLRSPDFFDVAQYPKITFKSTKVEPLGDNEYRVTGNLTMHGVTKQETFTAEYSGQVKDLYGLQRAAFSVKGTINRKDYGLNWNVALESGGVLVAEKVSIEIDLAAVQQVPAQQPAAQTA